MQTTKKYISRITLNNAKNDNLLLTTKCTEFVVNNKLYCKNIYENICRIGSKTLLSKIFKRKFAFNENIYIFDDVYHACRYANVEMLSAIINEESKRVTLEYSQMLVEASRFDNKEIIDFLLPDVIEKYGKKSAIFLILKGACLGAKYELCKEYCDYYSTWDYTYENFNIRYAYIGGSLDVISLFFEKCKPLSINYFNSACESGSIKLIDKLLSLNCNISKEDYTTGLLNAFKNGSINIIEKIIAHIEKDLLKSIFYDLSFDYICYFNEFVAKYLFLHKFDFHRFKNITNPYTKHYIFKKGQSKKGHYKLSIIQKFKNLKYL